MTVYEVGTYGFARGRTGRLRNWHSPLPADFYFVPWPVLSDTIHTLYTLQYL